VNRSVMLAQDSVRALKQFLASLRQYHAARRANEKLRAKLYLKLTNLHAYGRLRYGNALCPGCERASLCYCRESSKLSYLHSSISENYQINKIF
jgi:hypothetical protein